jgi:hypothetical protein
MQRRLYWSVKDYQSERRAGEPSRPAWTSTVRSRSHVRVRLRTTSTEERCYRSTIQKINPIIVLPTFYPWVVGTASGRRRHRCRFRACDTRGGPRYSRRADGEYHLAKAVPFSFQVVFLSPGAGGRRCERYRSAQCPAADPKKIMEIRTGCWRCGEEIQRGVLVLRRWYKVTHVDNERVNIGGGWDYFSNRINLSRSGGGGGSGSGSVGGAAGSFGPVGVRVRRDRPVPVRTCAGLPPFRS